jgi:hypothetical protein
MSAIAVLVDLVEDPKNNGDYKLTASSSQLSELWNAATKDADEILHLRNELHRLQEALAKVTTMETLKHMGYRPQ